MSTRSRIGIVQPDGKVKSIYCHHDGYPSYNGKVLKESYSTPERIEKLMALGNISSLGMFLDVNEAKGKDDDEIVCAYHRDYKEDFESNAPRMSDSIDDFMDSVIKSAEYDYVYLFNEGKWNVAKWRSRDFVELTDEIIKKD